jgi:hypothetical protein
MKTLAESPSLAVNSRKLDTEGNDSPSRDVFEN